MKDIALSRIDKLISNITSSLELLTGLTNSPNVLSVISSSTLIESIDRILNYYMFLLSYIKIKIKKDKISTALISDYLISLNYLINDYSMNIGYIIYLKNNLTTLTFTYTKVLNDDLVQTTANTSDFTNTSYILVLSDDFDKISLLLDEIYSYVKLIIESNITSLPDYFSKYKKIDPDRLRLHNLNNTCPNNNICTNNIYPHNSLNSNLANMLNNFGPNPSPKPNNILPKKNIFNKNKCDSLNISSLIDGIPTCTQDAKTTTKTNILFKKNKLKNILKSKTNKNKLKKNKQNKQNYIFNLLLTCFFVLVCIYNIVVLKYDIKLETKK
jgi:hypothetical protein